MVRCCCCDGVTHTPLTPLHSRAQPFRCHATIILVCVCVAVWKMCVSHGGDGATAMTP